MPLPPVLKPPFTLLTAHQKLKTAQALWNTQNPSLISQAYTPDSIWRNRTTFLQGRNSIEKFLTEKWKRELDYRLRKELFCFENRCVMTGSSDREGGEGERDGGGARWQGRIAVQFWYEYRDAWDRGKWKRCYGLEDWVFDEMDEGKMRKRQMSASDLVLGRDGDGVAVPEEGIEGRWFLPGVDIDGFDIEEKHY